MPKAFAIPTTTPSLAPGSAFGGYRVGALIDQNAISSLYTVHDEAGPATLEIITLDGTRERAQAALEFFEAHERLRSVAPTGSLPRTLDVGRTADGSVFAITSALLGTALDTYRAGGGGTLSAAEALAVVLQVLAAVEEAETLGAESPVVSERHTYAEAVATLRRAVVVAERLAEPNPEALGLVYNRLAATLLHLQTNGEDHPARFHNLVDTAAVLVDSRRFAEAVVPLQRALAVAAHAGMNGSPSTVFAQNNLGEAEEGLGRSTDALAHFDEAIAITEKTYGGRYWVVGFLRVNRARSLLSLGRPREALVEAEIGRSIVEETLPPEYDYVGRALATVGAANLGLAQALWSTCDHSSRTRALAVDAQTALRAAGARVDEVERWLAQPTGCVASKP